MRVSEAASRLEVSPATVYALIAAGRLRCSRIGLGLGVIRVSEEQLGDFLQATTQYDATPAPSFRLQFEHLRLF